MKLTGTEDLRVQKTITGIRTAFEHLMIERGLADITVKELCERARINKKTFYRYYPALEYLLVEVQEEYVSEYLARIRNLRLPRDVRPITRAFFLFSEEKGPLFEAITCERRFDAMRASLMEDVMGAYAEQTGDDANSYPTAFVTSATLGVYRLWIARGKDVPVEEIVERCCRMLEHGLLPEQI